MADHSDDRSLGALLDHAPVALLALDARGTITGAVGAATQALAPLGPIIGRSLAALADEPDAVRLLLEAAARGETNHARLRITNSAGTYGVDLHSLATAIPSSTAVHWWWDVTCCPAAAGALIVATDVTARVDAETARDHVLARARCILWHATVWEQGATLQWDLQLLNAEAGQMVLPLPPGQPWQFAWFDSRHPDDLEPMNAIATNALHSGASGYQQFFRCLSADGTYHWLHEVVEVAPAGPGRWQLAGVCTDATAEQNAAAAVALQNEHLRAGLALARDIQIGLLPHDLPFVTARVVLQARALPAYEVGGDFYLYRALDEDRVSVAIGDVSGKGVGAALMMALASSSVEEQARVITRPQQLLATLNAQLLPRMQANRMNTGLLYGVVDLQQRTLHVANAGMIAPILVRGNHASLLDAAGLPLGALPSARYDETLVALQPGDLIALVSDGVVEARDTEGRLFGFERLERALAENARAPSLDALLDEVLGRVDAFAGGAEQRDDMTMMLIQVR